MVWDGCLMLPITSRFIMVLTTSTTTAIEDIQFEFGHLLIAADVKSHPIHEFFFSYNFILS